MACAGLREGGLASPGRLQRSSAACFALWEPFLPGQVEQGLFGVVTRRGTAFIEDQTVLLESEQKEHVGRRKDRRRWEARG